MPRFTFKLRPLLNARIAAERQKQRELAGLQRERFVIEQRLRSQQERIDQDRSVQRNALVGRIDTHALRSHASSTMRLLRDAQRMAIELAQLHQRINQSRAELAEASMRRRAIELLHDRRLAEWKKRMEKHEEVALDDLIAAKAKRPQEMLE